MAYIKSNDSGYCGETGAEKRKEKPSEVTAGQTWPCQESTLHFFFAKSANLFQYLIFYQTLLLKNHRIVPKGIS